MRGKWAELLGDGLFGIGEIVDPVNIVNGLILHERGWKYILVIGEEGWIVFKRAQYNWYACWSVSYICQVGFILILTTLPPAKQSSS